MRATWKFLTLAALVIGSVFAVTGAVAAPPVSGAIFTTESTCTGVNLNIYGDKDDVYVDGGPAHPNAAGLPAGSYYAQVTAPDGTVLGQSVTASVTVNSAGEFAQCYQLSAILFTASSGYTAAGYDDTTNPGGEYKVWISTVSTFDNNVTKTDNFKVKETPCPEEDPECNPPGPPTATLNVAKFYDANANGFNDDAQPIVGWKVNIHDGIDFDRFTPVTMILDPDDYVVSEYHPIQANWFQTAGLLDGVAQNPINPVNVTLAADQNKTVTFGNLCVGAGGGLTLGFWSNKNGAKALSANSNAVLNGVLALNLRKADGGLLGSVNLATFQSWLLSANATNMANMLSAQLAAMKANVLNGNVVGTSLIYAPGTTSANSLGFATVNAIVAEANAELFLHGLTTSGGAQSAFRSYQEALKNALDKANNNLNFVQGTPCPFSFAGN
jgi:hypothetical protein